MLKIFSPVIFFFVFFLCVFPNGGFVLAGPPQNLNANDGSGQDLASTGTEDLVLEDGETDLGLAGMGEDDVLTATDAGQAGPGNSIEDAVSGASGSDVRKVP